MRRLLASRPFAEAMLRLIDRDPFTALHMATEHGLILYANDKAGRTFLGKGVRGADAMGLHWQDLFPWELVKERLDVLSDILRDRQPRYVRSIYFGLQVITRYDCVGSLEGVAGGERAFLCVTRHEPRALDSGDDGALRGVTIVEPRTHYMGPLAKLTGPELELLALIADGRAITEIADATGTNIHVANERRRSLGKKLDAQDRVRLAEIARGAGLKPGDAGLADLGHLARPMPKTAGPPVTPERLRELVCTTPGCVDGLWRALHDDPFTAFQVLMPDSAILHANQNVVRMFVPELGDVSDLLGKRYDEVAPAALVRDRMEIIASVARLRRARIQRSIYQGVQVITRLEWCGPVDGADAPSGLVLLAARRTPAEVVERLPARVRRFIVDPGVHRLGAIAGLTTREREVLALIGEGLSNKQIALRLHRTEDTIEDHRQRLGEKLGISDRVLLAECARRAGLTLRDADAPSVDTLTTRA